MKKLAILADIHGNLFALQAVIEDLERLNVDEVIVAGDLVGRGPQGDGVVKSVREQGWQVLRGNHEDYLLSFIRNDIPDQWRIAEEWAASRWMAAELSSSSADFIASLPFSLQSEADKTIEIFHGSPNSHTEGIGEWVSSQVLEEHLKAIDGKILVCAHTHRPLHYKSPAGEIINVGSVGLPFNRDWRAQYALFTGHEGSWEVSFRKVSYNREDFLAYYDSSGFLQQGGLTAQLLYREVQEARPFLVPFLKWAESLKRSPRAEDLDEFFQIFEPTGNLKDFFDSLQP